MRSLENVTDSSVREVLSFAARTLGAEKISPEQYDEIRRSALAMQQVVKSAIGESNEAKRAIKTVQRRRRNSQIAMQIQAKQARKDEKEIRYSYE